MSWLTQITHTHVGHAKNPERTVFVTKVPRTSIPVLQSNPNRQVSPPFPSILQLSSEPPTDGAPNESPIRIVPLESFALHFHSSFVPTLRSDWLEGCYLTSHFWVNLWLFVFLANQIEDCVGCVEHESQLTRAHLSLVRILFGPRPKTLFTFQYISVGTNRIVTQQLAGENSRAYHSAPLWVPKPHRLTTGWRASFWYIICPGLNIFVIWPQMTPNTPKWPRSPFCKIKNLY